MPRITEAPSAMGDRRRAAVTLMALAACAVYVCAVAFVPGFTRSSPVVCPTSRCLGLQCPSCGMTRAMACLVRCDVVSALRYNPLVVFAAPFAAGFTIDTLLEWSGRRGLTGRVPGLRRWGWRLLVASFVVVGLVRAATWLAPACNPRGWLMPPAEFPPPGPRTPAARSESTVGPLQGPAPGRAMGEWIEVSVAAW